MKLKWNFQRDGGRGERGTLRENPIHGRGMEILWNYITILYYCKLFNNIILSQACVEYEMIGTEVCSSMTPNAMIAFLTPNN